MGGNNLPGIITSRIPSKDYFYIKQIILDILHKNNIVAQCPIELPGKVDYGDIDVICEYPTQDFDFKQFIKTNFNPTVMSPSYRDKVLCNISFNSTLPSMIDFTNFQIDFILCPKSSIESYMFYFSYGDLGSIVGRLTNAYAIKFDYTGLWIKFNSITMEIKCQNTQDYCHLTDSTEELCKYLGLSYSDWMNGFTDMYDIFVWICKSHLFTPNIFRIFNRQHTSRLMKRKMFLKFLEYIGVDDKELENATCDDSEISYNRQQHAIDYFNKNSEIENIKKIRLLEKERTLKYNAHIFIKYGITGKDIGIKKKHFEEYITKTKSSFHDFIDSNTIDVIDICVRDFLELKL